MEIYRSTHLTVFREERHSQNPSTGNVGKLFNQPEIRMDAEEQYEALLHLADEFEDQGFISSQERGRLIEKATALYARSIVGRRRHLALA
jgi:hypothetical protein